MKARMDKTLQNSRCRLCGKRDETIIHIISESSKLALKEYNPGTTGLARWSTGNCEININLIIRTMVWTQPSISPGERDAQTPLGF